MRVAQINFLPAPEELAPADVLRHWPSLTDIAEMATAAGVRVSVLQAASRAGIVERDGVEYRFIDIGRMDGSEDRARRFADALDDIKADVAHVHGLAFAEEVRAMAGFLPSPPPFLFQDHADTPPHWLRRARWRRCHAAAAGFAFTSLAQARPFAAARLFAPHTRLFAIPECSSRFRPGDRERARAETGLHGDPCVLWVGHLSHGKDPLCALEGIAAAAQHLPDLQLWCAFGTAPLLATVRARIDRDPRLRGRVHLLGVLPHERIESLLQASDIFVSASRSESCGYAALEAIACDVTPVLTDIPAFRALTGDGRIGHLWPCGNAMALAEAIRSAATATSQRGRIRAHFDANLSFAAVGRRWVNAYSQLLEDRWRRAG